MPFSHLLKKRQSEKAKTKITTYQSRSSGWGMLIGLLIALGVAIGLMIATPRMVSNHLRYFDAETQEFYRERYGEPQNEAIRQSLHSDKAGRT